MTERIVSPGVFTRERDLSFLSQGISEIGGAFIGPTPKGPAFIPTIVRSPTEYVTRFGEADSSHYTGLTVKNYLGEAGVATIVRVLGLNGYVNTAAIPAEIFVTGSTGTYLYAVLHPTSRGNSITTCTAGGGTSSFSLLITASGGGNVSASGFSTDENGPTYLGNYLGFTPSVSSSTAYGAYIYSIFPEAATLAGATASLYAVTASNALFLSGSTYGAYMNASTPWITSQATSSMKIDLFKLHTLSDGNSSNKEIKVSLIDMRASGDTTYKFGTFTLLVRAYDDTDTNMTVLETYNNLNLDPNSSNFIARVIGNSAPTEDQVTGEMYYQGDFTNNSKYIYVEMGDAAIPDDALPFGFEPYNTPFGGVALASVVPPNMVTTRWLSGAVPGYTTTAIDKKYYYGWDFSDSQGTNPSYLAPLPSGSIASTGSAFTLTSLPDVPSTSAPFSKSISLTDDDSFNYRKFSVAFQGGFDGLNPARDIALGGDIVPTNSQGFNLSSTTAEGYLSYKQALDAISNPEQYDFNLLVLPGVIYQHHSAVATAALTLCEERQDAFYIMDTTDLNATLATATSKAAEFDSSYAATYYPWLRVIDTNTNRLLWVPPSVILPEIYAYNDNVAAEWFAPAGLNRGGISAAVGVKQRLSQGSRDTLYEGRVNPIAQFPGQGICVWGQKTLQRRPSALDRVNVRRLLIAVKKYIASASRYLVFEQNVEATRNRFLNIANPYLASVQERSGLYAFRVIMDASNNTNDVIDRNILYGQLFLQPTKTAEFIILDFNVLPTGATFPTG